MPETYERLRPVFSYIEKAIKPESEEPRLYTLAGSIAIKREKLPLITKKSLVNADLFLFQLSTAYNFPADLRHWCWFPTLYIYGGVSDYVSQPIWTRMISIKQCQKLFPLFGVTDIALLKDMIEKSKPDRDIRYPESFDSAATILDSIELEKIGTML